MYQNEKKVNNTNSKKKPDVKISGDFPQTNLF